MEERKSEDLHPPAQKEVAETQIEPIIVAKKSKSSAAAGEVKASATHQQKKKVNGKNFDKVIKDLKTLQD